MGKDPAFLFYSQDFIVGVQTMNFEDRGRYITILAQMHQQGRLDEETIRFIVGNISVKLKAKFSIDDNGLWFNERLEEEMEKRSAFVDSRRENGSKGGRPRKATGKPNGKPTGYPKLNLGEDEDENVIKSINVEFEIFWKLYDKKVGDKSKIEKKWIKLKDKERELVIEHLKEYVKYTPDKQFRKNPDTYLNQSGWEHEVIKTDEPKKDYRPYD